MSDRGPAPGAVCSFRYGARQMDSEEGMDHSLCLTLFVVVNPIFLVGL